MAEWIEPKMDWTSSDFFNVEDYNRIIGNISFLKSYMDELFANLTQVSLGEEKTYESLFYASEMNNIEQALETLNLETYKLSIGEMQTYRANKPTPLWSEFNRIENAIYRLHKMMVVHKANLPRLAFSLGNQKGIKV